MNLWETKKCFSEGTINKIEYIDQMHELHTMLYEYAQFLKETEIGSIELTDGRVVMTTRDSGIRIICDPTDRRTAPVEALNFGAYEHEHLEMVYKLIPENGLVLDIGANIGWYSLQISKHIKNVRIHAFEPIANTYRQLVANLQLNKMDNVLAHNFGLSNEEKELVFYYEPDCSGRASARNLSGNTDVQEIRCKVFRLDEIKELQNQKIDFIKCDCEGGELFVLQGASKILTHSQPVIFCEMLRKWAAKFDYHPTDIVALLKSFGYACFTLKNKKLLELKQVDEQTADTNFFFLHTVRHAHFFMANSGT